MRITAIGEILIDLTQAGFDADGNAVFAAIPGGAPANVAVAARKLGAETAFIGCVGDDAFGRILVSTLNKFGVDSSALDVTDRASTTLAVVTVDGKGERSFSFCRKPGADTRIDAKKAANAAECAGILHFGSVSLTDPDSRASVASAVRAAKQAGALITYDPNYRASLWKDGSTAKRIIRKPIPYCDIIKISDEETELLTGTADIEKAADKLIARGVSIVIVTLGAEGAYWRTAEGSGRVPGFKVKVADTNGAGDTFFGAFLSRIAKRGGIEGITADELDEFVRFANKAASITASRRGAIPAMPTLDEVSEV